MGLYDHVSVSGDAFRCSEGHDLSDHGFQSKDFGCTMGRVCIPSDGIATFDPNAWGHPVESLTGEFEVYTSCTHCPAFVQARTHNLIDVWVEFRVVLDAGRVVSVTRISPSTTEFLRDTPTKEWMRDCKGPMPYADAHALHVKGIFG